MFLGRASPLVPRIYGNREIVKVHWKRHMLIAIGLTDTCYLWQNMSQLSKGLV